MVVMAVAMVLKAEVMVGWLWWWCGWQLHGGYVRNVMATVIGCC